MHTFEPPGSTGTDDHHGAAPDTSPHPPRLVVAGPPCAGKTLLVQRLHGRPGSDILDLTQSGWWRLPCIDSRLPSELNLALPFVGLGEALTVADPRFSDPDHPLVLETPSILMPPRRQGLFSIDWRSRTAFEFLLPPAEELYANRIRRIQEGTYFAGRHFNLERIERELRIFWELARYLRGRNMEIYVREGVENPAHKLPMEN